MLLGLARWAPKYMRLGALSGPSWGPPGLWGASWAGPGQSWVAPGTVFGASWAVLGASWAVVELSWAVSGPS
eukprot:5294771-Pyramimonas_sp.AAC.1